MKGLTMSARAFQYTEFLTFSSARSLPYGQNVTILEEPIRQNGHWVVNALLSSSEHEEILLSSGQLIGKRFVVVRSERSGMNYSHRAVLEDEISRETRKIEENIANLLKRI